MQMNSLMACYRVIVTAIQALFILTTGSQAEATICASPPPTPPASINMIVLYLQDFSSGINATNAMVAGIQGKPYDFLQFGTVDVVDDNMTTTIDRNSTLLGQAQGTLITAALDGSGSQVTLTFVFSGGPYAGGTLVALGISEQLAQQRKVSIVGGTGPLLYATGYATFQTAFLQQLYDVIKATLYFKFFA